MLQPEMMVQVDGQIGSASGVSLRSFAAVCVSNWGLAAARDDNESWRLMGGEGADRRSGGSCAWTETEVPEVHSVVASRWRRQPVMSPE